MAKKSVKPIEPKYAAEKGSRGPEIRCFAYVAGPMRTAHEAKNSTDPKVHLRMMSAQAQHLVFDVINREHVKDG